MRHLFHFEKRAQPLATRRRFVSRLSRNAFWAFGIIAAWLLIGMAGYGGLEGMDALDAFENAAMILSGMGPVTVLQHPAAKLFAGTYAIFSGLLIFGAAGLILAPVFHRIMHSFHIEDTEDEPKK
jgi:hypothetical protein